jgi:hypothetical protein
VKKSILTLCIILFAAFISKAQISYPENSPASVTNGNVGINQPVPNARLHISDDPSQLNCVPAILINSNSGSSAGGGTIGGDGPEDGSISGTCTTPYIFRNILQGANSLATTVHIDGNGKAIFGDIYNFSTVNGSRFSIENNLGLYQTASDYTRFGYNTTESSTEPLLYWNSSASQPFSIGYGSDETNLTRILTVQSEKKVGINTTMPLAALHVKSELEAPNEGTIGQIQGLLIENNGYRNHDFAFEIRTGQLGEAMQNGRVFTVSNAGTVHIGEGLNWATPSSGSLRYRLYVQGGIRTEKVKVDIASENQWADHVFDESYKLMSWQDLEKFINENKHLPGVPSASEVVENGVDLAEMNKILLEKVEELTLRVIELEKKSQSDESFIGSWSLDSTTIISRNGRRTTTETDGYENSIVFMKGGDYKFTFAGYTNQGHYRMVESNLELLDQKGGRLRLLSYQLKGGVLSFSFTTEGITTLESTIYHYSR